MKKILTTLTFIYSVALAYGQQEYSFTHYFDVNSFYNPASTGFRGSQDMNFLFRSQWTGFKGAPFSTGLNYERPISKYNMGIGGYAFIDIDLAYNPGIQQFENLDVYTVFLGFEHDWLKEFTSALGGSILGSEEKSFFNDGYFRYGNKILTNLFYKPAWETGNLLVGVEIEYAERKNMNTPSNNTIRASTFLIYNF